MQTPERAGLPVRSEATLSTPFFDKRLSPADRAALLRGILTRTRERAARGTVHDIGPHMIEHAV